MTDHYKAGQDARRAYLASDQYRQFPADMPGIDAMKLFLPPVPQDMMQVSRPLPSRWAEWVRGWDSLDASRS